MYEWRFWARDKQLPPPGDWRVWLLLAGRGFGKSRTGAEWVRAQVEQGRARRIALVARTTADVRDVVVEGESGILSVSPPWFLPRWEPSKRRLTWPNGAIATTYTGDAPDQLRGPQHDAAWCDELAAWRYPDAWDQLQFGLRLGDDPRVVVTTTPRPTRVVRDLVASPTTQVTRGASVENRAHLAPAFFDAIVKKYEGTRLGRQELLAQILDDNPFSLWRRQWLDDGRVVRAPDDLKRVVVAVDPGVSDGDNAAETGIIVCGLATSGHGYVLDDVSLRGSPSEWAAAAVSAFHRYEADRIIAECNQGGDMVRHTLHTVERNAPVEMVRATRGKATRAEPVAALYEQSRVHHVGAFAQLEDQLCEWEPGQDSPDRLDALVWGLTALMLGAPRQSQVLKSPWCPPGATRRGR